MYVCKIDADTPIQILQNKFTRNEPKFQPPIRLVVALMKMDPGMLNDCFSFQNDFILA